MQFDDRTNHPTMEYYREVYKDSSRWDGTDKLFRKEIIIYCEQGFGDIFQFARYIPILRKQKRCKIDLHCPIELHRLFKNCLDGVRECYDKKNFKLPPHDYHVLSMDLPFLLSRSDYVPKEHIPGDPYILCKSSKDLSDYDGLKIGIAWEGRSIPTDRSCPLKYFKPLQDRGRLFMLHQSVTRPELIEDCDDIDLLGVEINDFLDVAELINSVDVVVSIDTAALHLAGAMGKKTFGLMTSSSDVRFGEKEITTPWYSSVELIRTEEPDNWGSLIGQVSAKL